MKVLIAAALTASMVASTVAAVHLTPRPLYAPGEKPAVGLNALVPASFGDWKLDTSAPPQIVSPSMTAELERIYTDTVTRTYLDSAGNRVMLSLAYGADQSRSMQIHKPEVCYEAQGFKMVYSAKEDISLGARQIPAMRLVAKQGARSEPITYWIRSGDYIVRGWFEQNYARIKNGIVNGVVPDGLLVRVSTIDSDKSNAYQVHNDFIEAMITHSPKVTQAMLLGSSPQSVVRK